MINEEEGKKEIKIIKKSRSKPSVANIVVPSGYSGDLSILRSIVDRVDLVCKPGDILLNDKRTMWGKVSIATISLDLKEKTEPQNLPRSHTDASLFQHKTDSYELIRKEALENIRLASELGANYICMNEMAYPYSPTHKEFRNLDQEFKNELILLSTQKDTYILAGTFHSAETDYNLCPIFYPPRVDSEEKTIYHAKKTSAESYGEKVRIPYKRSFRYYKTKFFNMGILICLDVCDVSLILRLLKINNRFSREKDIDILFVPSYSKNPGKLMEACEEVSKCAANIVVFVNTASHPPAQGLFVAGEPIPGDPKNKNLTLFTVDLEQFDNKRHSLLNESTPLYNYVLGFDDPLYKKVPYY